MKKLIFTVILLLAASLSHAFDIRALESKLSDYLAPYGGKVGVAFIDCQTMEQFSVNGDLPYPAASVIKMPIMTTLFFMSDRSLVDINERVVLKNSDKLEGSGVLRWLKAGNSYTLWGLARMMISISDNTATRLLVRKIGQDNINDFCKLMGLNNTRLNDETALVEPPANCNRTSPNDMASLIYKIKYGNAFSPKAVEDMLAFMKNQRYRWGIVKPLPPGTIVANKTGNLTGVLNDVGMVYTDRGNYILAIMTWKFQQKSEARKVINRISEMAYNFYVN
ncbi:MAG: serine hydrolase [Candidatus Margulisiibacteriota bacterium]|nr:class A beta-lactamase-related serine hydrolase [Candidatus Margulisiibacteriota bacterium]